MGRAAPRLPPPSIMSEETIQSPGFGAAIPHGRTAEKQAFVRESASAVPALGLEGISLSFGGVKALTAVDLEIASGEILSIIGPNGAGKSSLVNVISGIYRPDRGRIHLGGRAFKQVPTHKLARLGVARTFQNLALFKGLSVLDNVKIARVIHRRATLLEQLAGLGRARREEADALARSNAVIDFLDLTSVRHAFAGTLPYGIQKRVELARALVAEPQLLLLDEPMAGMTPGGKSDMTRYIRAARDEFGTTVILIEHDISVVMDISDRVAVLDYGRKIADAAPAEVKTDQAVIDAYMGVDHEESLTGEAA